MCHRKEHFLRELDRVGAGPRAVHVFDSIDSTSSELVRRIRGGEPSGTLVAAMTQTSGRGRTGNRWFSPQGGNLYISVAVQVTGPPERNLPLVPLCAGVALFSALCECGVEGHELKWPNDLLYKGKKLGGILCEAPDLAVRPLVAVVGLGLNLATTRFCGELAGKASDLVSATGVSLSPPRVASLWILGMEGWIERACNEGPAQMVRSWKEGAEPFGRMAKVGNLRGRTVDLDESGRLLLERESGEVIPVAGGVVEYT